MKKQIISASLLVVGFLVGASALSAIAAWSGPSIKDVGETDCNPPHCNVPAPVNVGSSIQSKIGLLGLNDSVIKSLRVLTSEGTTTTNTSIGTGGISGKVLTAINSNGDVGWRSVSGGGFNNVKSGVYTGGSQCTNNTIADSVVINFPTPFPPGALPNITTSLKWNQDNGNGGPRVWITSVTLSSFNIHWKAPDASCAGEKGIMWIAVQ